MIKIFLVMIFIQILALVFINCDDTYDSLECISSSTDGGDAVVRGKDSYICIHFILPEKNAENMRVAKKITYKIEVDLYTALDLSGAFSKFEQQYGANDEQFEIQMVVQAYNRKGKSPEAQYIAKTKVFPLQNVVITANEGIIEQVQFDNGDFTGMAYDSTEKNEYLDYQACSGNCDPTIYVSWLGTDKDGNYMTSAGLRMSRFAKYSGESFYNAANEKFK